MRKIDDPSTVKVWSYHDLRLGKGFMGTRNHIIMQVQEAYLRGSIEFQENEIGARIDNYMCEQGFARPCSERIEGLGDVVKLAFNPFAKAIDGMLGTAFSSGGCSTCEKNKEALNRLVPL